VATGENGPASCVLNPLAHMTPRRDVTVSSTPQVSWQPEHQFTNCEVAVCLPMEPGSN